MARRAEAVPRDNPTAESARCSPEVNDPAEYEPAAEAVPPSAVVAAAGNSQNDCDRPVLEPLAQVWRVDERAERRPAHPVPKAHKRPAGHIRAAGYKVTAATATRRDSRIVVCKAAAESGAGGD